MGEPRVAIVGAALSDCGSTDDKTALDLVYQGITRALADAGLDKEDVQGFGSIGTTLPPIEVSEYLRLRPRWVDSTNVGGSTWLFMAQHAAAAIRSGEVDIVALAYGSTARSDVKRRRRTGMTAVNSAGPLQFDVPYGHTLISKYAMVAQRHMYEFGTTIEELAEVAVAARLHAGRNPLAFYRDPITVDDVLSAPMVADPFTILHCCLRTDGGGAVILAGEDRARIFARARCGYSDPDRPPLTPP